MAYDGSTLCAELNRLANGGASYPDMTVFLAEGGAANAWAGTDSLTVVGALNVKAGNADVAQWRDLAGVCNQLAGTSDLEPAAALREVAS